MSNELAALLGTLFGGVALKVVEGWFARATQSQVSDSQRIDKLWSRVDALQVEVDSWKGKYYDLQAKYNDLERQYQEVCEQLERLTAAGKDCQ